MHMFYILLNFLLALLANCQLGCSFFMFFDFKSSRKTYLRLLCEEYFFPGSCQRGWYRSSIWTLVMLSGLWVSLSSNTRCPCTTCVLWGQKTTSGGLHHPPCLRWSFILFPVLCTSFTGPMILYLPCCSSAGTVAADYHRRLHLSLGNQTHITCMAITSSAEQCSQLLIPNSNFFPTAELLVFWLHLAQLDSLAWTSS